MTRTVYLTRNGLLEPLGQSQVLAYLRGLARDYDVTLITFEKPGDWQDRAAMERMREVCRDAGIDWRPRRFRTGPRLIAPAWSMAEMLVAGLRAIRAEGAVLVHARSYLPAAIAWGLWRLTGTPFVFDMRALWPEELITAGRLGRGGALHRIITLIERACLRDAAAVISLTEAAVGHLRDIYPAEMSGQRVEVIPTCADLDRFSPGGEGSDETVFGCIGTVLSGWFRLDWLSAFVAAAAARYPDARFEIVTRDEAEAVRKHLDPKGALGDRLAVFPLPSERVHEAARRQTASAMFFTTGLSKLGSSPTRMAEILGCGRPVIANPGVGDVAGIVERYRVGVLVEGNSPEEMARALEALEALLADPGLAARCRTAAEEVFSLEAGTEAYRRVYGEILGSIEASPAALSQTDDKAA